MVLTTYLTELWGDYRVIANREWQTRRGAFS